MTGQVKVFDKTNIDLSQVADGVYTGHSETDLVKVEVRVTVAEGMIRDIEIFKHECGKGRPANEIVNDIHVINLNIVQVKQKHGIIERENYNKPKSENSRQPGCPEEKVEAIEEALKYFQMI